MSIFEKPQDRRERQKGYFLEAFRSLHKEGKDWMPMTEFAPRAAGYDPVYMRRRNMVNNILDLFGLQREALPGGLTYPPRGNAEDIADELVAEQLVERTPNAIARYDLSGHEERAYIYRLVPDQEPVVPQPDAVITA